MVTKTLATSNLNRRRLVQATAAAGVVAALPVAVRPVAAQETLKIAFSVPSLGFPFFRHMMNLAAAYAEEVGGIELVELDGQQGGAPSSTKQSSDLEAAVVQGVQGVVISPNDGNALQPSIQALIDSGIPVVTVDRNVEGADTMAHVGADNVRGGELQGEFIVQLLADGGQIFELQGQPGATPAIDRHAGLDAVLSENEQIEVVASETAEFSRDRAVTVFEALLAANPPPQAVVCANDDMAFGVAQVASEQGLGDLAVVGFDALPEALVAIQNGSMAATIEQFPGLQATTALDIMIAYLRDGTVPEEHDIYLEPGLITADNLADAERAEEAGVGAAATPEA